MVKILICATGSVASIKIPILISSLRKEINDCHVKLAVTPNSLNFFNQNDIPEDVSIMTDDDEWKWKRIGDPIPHIDLGNWADLCLIAPLDANTLAKISNGLCDNLVTCIVRAWNENKKMIIAPAMNTQMWIKPITMKQINSLPWMHVILPIFKGLACGTEGIGAMENVDKIVEIVRQFC